MPAYLGSGYATGIKWTSSPKKQPTKPEVNTNKVRKKGLTQFHIVPIWYGYFTACLFSF